MMDFDFEAVSGILGSAWCAALLLHFVSGEESGVRILLLKIFARWVEVPLLWFLWAACRGPFRFLTRVAVIRKILGVAATRPFGLYMDTGVPIPTKDVLKLLDILEGPIAVGDCRCRLAKKTCDHPMRADIVIRTGAEAWLWAFPDNYELIDKAEAAQIISSCADQDMFQMIFIHCSNSTHVNEYVICNCCPCGCKVHLLNRTMGQEYFPLRDGGFRSHHDPARCDLCGECVPKCPFGAIRMGSAGIEVVDCFGCGVCERVCEKGAFEVTADLPGPPWSQEAWRAAGISR